MSKEQAWSHFPPRTPAAMQSWDQAVRENVGNLSSKEEFLTGHWEWRTTIEAYQVVSILHSLVSIFTYCPLTS